MSAVPRVFGGMSGMSGTTKLLAIGGVALLVWWLWPDDKSSADCGCVGGDAGETGLRSVPVSTAQKVYGAAGIGDTRPVGSRRC